VVQRLTGEITVDIADASFPFLDPERGAYDEEALAVCGLSGRRNLLADPARPMTVRALSRSGADLLGVPTGLPVVQAPFDLPACAIGAGVSRPGDGLLIVGTTLACEVLTDRVDFDRDGEPAGLFLTMPWPDRYLRALPAMVGTACLDWACTLLGIGLDEVDPLLAQSEPGAHGVTALPFFAPGGERAPFVAPGATAQLTGMRLGTTRADVLRAVCEGVAYAARSCLEAAGLSGELRACGGGVRSTEWTKIFADVLGTPIVIPADEGIGTRGAALVATEALGHQPDWIGRTRVVDCELGRHGRYQDGYAEYQRLLAEARNRWETA
jgi:erythritol kinase